MTYLAAERTLSAVLRTGRAGSPDCGITPPGWVLGATITVFVIGAIRERQRQIVTDVERLV